MDIQVYFDQKQQLYDAIYKYIDDDNNEDASFLDLVDFFKINNIADNHEELLLLFHLIISIANNYHRNKCFFSKIEKILLFFKDIIQQTCSSLEIFSIFLSNKRLLLFLIQNNIIAIDDSIKDLFEYFPIYLKYPLYSISLYLYPDIKPFLTQSMIQKIETDLYKIDVQIFDNHDKKRQIGENDSYICSLIRDDLIDDFIIYVNQRNIPLSSYIHHSIYETNSFLIKNNKTTLIEYAAFFGAIQIFRFLQINKVELTASLWCYAIHGRNPEIIHFLEESKVGMSFYAPIGFIIEAIKCHHNEIANYFLNIFDEIEIFNSENIMETCFLHYNYSFIKDITNYKYIFSYSCQAGFHSVAENILKTDQLYIDGERYSNFAMFNSLDRNNLPIDIIGKDIMINNDEITHDYQNMSNCSFFLTLTIPSFVTIIGNNAFYKLYWLKNINIAPSVKTIGLNAFSNCIMLEQIQLPPSLTYLANGAFNKCENLKSIELPSSLTVINSSTFNGCSSLKRVIIPNSITRIEDSVFYNCASLTELIIPSSVSFIGFHAFRGCSSLAKITFDENSSLQSIGQEVFDGCSSLKEIYLPNLLEKIPNRTFKGCISLIYVDIPLSVKCIGRLSFEKCTSLKEIKIPKSVTSIGKSIFKGCQSLKKVILPKHIKSKEIEIEPNVNIIKE